MKDGQLEHAKGRACQVATHAPTHTRARTLEVLEPEVLVDARHDDGVGDGNGGAVAHAAAQELAVEHARAHVRRVCGR